MPPPAFHWFCVLSSTVNILGHAARIRASQLAGNALQSSAGRTTRADREYGDAVTLRDANGQEQGTSSSKPSGQAGVNSASPARRVDASPAVPSTSSTVPLVALQPKAPTQPSLRPLTSVQNSASSATQLDELSIEHSHAEQRLLETTTPVTEELAFQPISPFPEFTQATRTLSSSKVPSSRIGRLFHYGGLAASLGYGAASELIRRSNNNESAGSSLIMTEANIKRLVSKLVQMRGAALKLGQFLSIQDTHVLPAEIDEIFRRVQDSAHYMPDWQMEEVMKASLGADWMSYFDSFERVPFAAASIGQVHNATLKAEHSPTGVALPVAVKIQFPEIANSIQSDLGYIKLLLTAGKLLPNGLFLDRTVEVMKGELADECNYSREARFANSFRYNLENDERFKVPWVWHKSTERVLVMEHIGGVSVGEANVKTLSQSDRDEIASRVVELCLKELFQFRMMQTDPNWTNFLWDPRARKIGLVDFGATREYSKEFLDGWLGLLSAAASDDLEACAEWSVKVGYLTGEETQPMVDAHVKSMTLLATPFKSTTPMPFSFGPKTAWADITAEIRAQIPVMLQHRLTPPPKETYSLNRKLSGAFLLAARLEATIDTKKIWDSVVGRYRSD